MITMIMMMMMLLRHVLPETIFQKVKSAMITLMIMISVELG